MTFADMRGRITRGSFCFEILIGMDQSNSSSNDLSSVFGEVIHKYTHAQAIADGVLVDVTTIAQEAGWKYPVAVTAALWSVIKTIPAKYPHEDVQGRLWDVIWMATLSARGAKPGTSRFTYKLILHREGTRIQYTELVCECGPGDRAEPVITIGFSEDF